MCSLRLYYIRYCTALLLSQVLQPWADGVEPRRKVIVAFDTGDDNFRHELSPSYKKDRTEAPDALR